MVDRTRSRVGAPQLPDSSNEGLVDEAGTSLEPPVGMTLIRMSYGAALVDLPFLRLVFLGWLRAPDGAAKAVGDVSTDRVRDVLVAGGHR